MALTRSELESITRDFFLADNGAAWDNYFTSNYLINRGLKKPIKKPKGGVQIKLPLTYDRMAGGSFYGADQFDTAHRTTINSALFPWKNYYVNVTVTWDEELENNGPEEEVDMVVSKLENAQNSIQYDLGDGLYTDGTGNTSKDLTGLLALFNTTTSTAYGGITEADMSVWSAKASSTSAAFTPAVVRAMRTGAKVGDSQKDKPNLVVTTDTLYDSFLNQLQMHQRMDSPQAAKAGFDGVLMLDQAEIFADGKCPSGNCFALNDRFWGFIVHANAEFVRTAWKVPTNQATKSMQILWKGNMVCSRRSAHYRRSGLS